MQTANASLATVMDSDGNVVDVTPVKENRISFATEAGKSYTLKRHSGIRYCGSSDRTDGTSCR